MKKLITRRNCVHTVEDRKKGMVLKQTCNIYTTTLLYLANIPEISSLYYNKEITLIDIDFSKVKKKKISIRVEFNNYKSRRVYNRNFDNVCKEGETAVIWNSICGDGVEDCIKISKGRYYCQYAAYVKGRYTVKELGPYNQVHIDEFNGLIKKFKSPHYVFCAGVDDLKFDKYYISCSQDELIFFVTSIISMLEKKIDEIQESKLYDNFCEKLRYRIHNFFDGYDEDTDSFIGNKYFSDGITICGAVYSTRRLINDMEKDMKQSFKDEVEEVKRKELENASNLLNQLTDVLKLIKAESNTGKGTY
ncbi:hypothetical protein [Vallitalea guaymasensis]|uniref:hypothetical protein n=1 Tax=Vallitalea guaymasensis TaxID=1185412 RepID=UPI000DE31308|nr:hypothetical protein [Vallitalea guaymasensis]